MFKESGFKLTDKSGSLSPEYVLLQRDEVVKQHQKIVIDLQDKITLLKGKVASLELDLVLAFSDRLKAVERRETESKAILRRVSDQQSALTAERDVFEDTIREQREENEKELSNITDKIKANETWLNTIRDQKNEMDKQEKIISEYGSRMEKLETELNARKILLDGREKNIEIKRKEIQQALDTLDSVRKAQKEEEEVLSVSRSINKSQMVELDDLNRRLKITQKESEEAVENLKTLNEQNKLLGKEVSEIAKGNKEKGENFAVWENELRVQEKELKQRKQDLDERQARVENLEKEGAK